MGAPAGDRPSGTIGLLFTDVEASTQFWDEHPAEMRRALASHDALLRSVIEAHGGYVFSTAGDAFAAAFHTPLGALGAALEAQQGLQAQSPTKLDLRVRMGVHAGSAEERDGNYFGSAVNRAARLMGLAHGRQVLVSLAAEELVRDELPSGVTLVALGEHRLRGLSRSETLFQLDGPGLATSFPPLAIGPERRGNLPTPLTSFVGRTAERRRLQAELAEHRLVSLVGPGGIGKTRLSIECAHAARDRFGGGVWFVELAPVTDPSGVLHAIAAGIDAPLRSGEDPVGQIVASLGARDCLVVIDNCEHVIDAVVDVLTAVLVGAAGTSLLCTSRESLGVPGERVWPVSGLADDGVELFLARARAHRADFDPDESDRATIAEICRRLDQMPLAIELAAARMRSLTPVDLHARLAERLLSLGSTRARRGADERHQTLRDAVAWSYDLLDPAERALFERLSVFAGGFTPTAVEAVCADGDVVIADEVVDLLDSLVTRSMITLSVVSGQRTRYSMLETLRQYGDEVLNQHADRDVWTARHARHIAAIAADLEARLVSPAEADAWVELSAEWDNIRAGFGHSLGGGDHDAAARIVAALGAYAFFASRNEIGEWAEILMTNGFAAGHSREVDVAGVWAWWAYWVKADLPLARRATAAYLDRPGHDRHGQCQFAGFMAAAVGARDQATADTLTVRWLAEPAVSPVAAVMAQFVRGLYGTWFDDPAVDAVAHADRAFELAVALGAPSMLAYARFMQGAVSIYRDPETAMSAFRESIEISSSLSEHHLVAVNGRAWFANAVALLDDMAAALEVCRASLDEARHLRIRTVVAISLRTSAVLLARAGDVVAAARLLGAAEGTGHTGHSVQPLVDRALVVIDDALGSPRRQDLVAEGRRLDLTAATDLAIAALGDAGPLIEAIAPPFSPAG